MYIPSAHNRVGLSQLYSIFQGISRRERRQSKARSVHAAAFLRADDHPATASLLHTKKMGSGRGETAVWRRRHALSYAAVALAFGWAGYSFHAMAGRRSAKSMSFDAAAEAAESRLSQEGASVGREAWDPNGCQTIVFFHVPKTGGESINHCKCAGGSWLCQW